MQTYIEAVDFVVDPEYQQKRNQALVGLKKAELDAPMQDIVRALSERTECFPMQSCAGHFVRKGDDPHTLEFLPTTGSGTVHYRIAYLAVCVETSAAGREFLRGLRSVSQIRPEYIQFGCATWFMGFRPNVFVLQVQPERLKTLDSMDLDHAEALCVQSACLDFRQALRTLLL